MIPRDQGSIPGQVIPKTQNMVLDAALLDTQHYQVKIKGKVKQSRKRSRVPLSLHLGVVAIKKGAFGSPSIKIANFTLTFMPLCPGIFQFGVYLSVALSESRCIFAFNPSLSPCNAFLIFLIHPFSFSVTFSSFPY